MNLTIHSRRHFLRRVQRSWSWETLSKAPDRSKLSIETMKLELWAQAVCTTSTRRDSAEIVERFLRAPIWVYGTSVTTANEIRQRHGLVSEPSTWRTNQRPRIMIW